jgi:hypothetical protein
MKSPHAILLVESFARVQGRGGVWRGLGDLNMTNNQVKLIN